MTDGRLFKLRLNHSHAARQAALSSVRQAPRGTWQARIGGQLRGETRTFPTRTAAERAVHAHYNAALLAYIKDSIARRRPHAVHA